MHIRYFVMLLTSVLLFTGGILARAQECKVTTVEKKYTVYFRVNESALDPTYLNNAQTLERMVKEIGSALSEEGRVSCSIEIFASASPEGRYVHNERLSKRRMDVVLAMLRKRIDISDVTLHANSLVEDWAIVAEYVAGDQQVPFRAEVLEAFARLGVTQASDTQAAGNQAAGTQAAASNQAAGTQTASNPAPTQAGSFDMRSELMKIGGGKAYEYILNNFFPLLRSANVVAVYDFSERMAQQGQLQKFDVTFTTGVCSAPIQLSMPQSPWLAQAGPQQAGPQQVEPSVENSSVVCPDRFRHSLKLKTNIIGWGMGHANIAVEWAFAKHFSVALPFYYSGGFDYFKETWKFRGIVLQPEIRYYVGGKRNSNCNEGFYVGAHFGIGWYNYAIGQEFRIQDHEGERPAYGGGIAVGYAMPFKKNPRWGMEFAIGAGVYDAVYDSFYNEPNGAYAEFGKRTTWWGIDNAAISFTYKFPFNKKEGRK